MPERHLWEQKQARSSASQEIDINDNLDSRPLLRSAAHGLEEAGRVDFATAAIDGRTCTSDHLNTVRCLV